MHGARVEIIGEVIRPAIYEMAAGETLNDLIRLAGGFKASAARQRGYFNQPFITRVLDEHLSGRRDHSLRLWQLLVFELWNRHYVDAAAAA